MKNAKSTLTGKERMQLLGWGMIFVVAMLCLIYLSVHSNSLAQALPRRP